MLSVGINTTQATRQLELLTLDPRKRRRITRGAARKVRRDSKKRIKNQKDLVGRNWQQRSNGKKQRMLKKLGKHMQVKSNPNSAQVNFGNPLVGKIARAHQDGVDLEMTASEAAKKYGTPGDDVLASREQAKALKKEGYKVRKNKGKGWKSPSIKWIQQNLSMRQAGLILRFMRNKTQKTKWVIPLPERSFLGQSQSELVQLKNYMLDEATRLAA